MPDGETSSSSSSGVGSSADSGTGTLQRQQEFLDDAKDEEVKPDRGKTAEEAACEELGRLIFGGPAAGDSNSEHEERMMDLFGEEIMSTMMMS